MKNNQELKVIFSKVAWCGHCTNFLPVFNKSQKLTKNNKYLKNTNVNFEVYDMEEDLEKFKSNNYEDLLPQINGYPTVIVTSLKNGKRVNTEIIDHSSDPLQFINTVGETYNKLVSQKGGYEEEELYKQKYLKYKSKYAELKEQIGGTWYPNISFIKNTLPTNIKDKEIRDKIAERLDKMWEKDYYAANVYFKDTKEIGDVLELLILNYKKGDDIKKALDTGLNDDFEKNLSKYKTIHNELEKEKKRLEDEKKRIEYEKKQLENEEKLSKIVKENNYVNINEMKKDIRWYRNYTRNVTNTTWWGIERDKDPVKWDKAKKVSALLYAEKIEIY
jgi:thiol-disulfide isomerase/thioredoxin